MKYIDVRFEFAEIEDDFEEGVFYYDLIAVHRLHSTVPETEVLGIQETLAQSDFYHIEVAQGLIDVLGGGTARYGK